MNLLAFFLISLLCILYFYDDERCKMNFPVRDNKVLLYCIVLYCIVLYCIVLYCIVLYCIVLVSLILNETQLRVIGKEVEVKTVPPDYLPDADGSRVDREQNWAMNRPLWHSLEQLQCV